MPVLVTGVAGFVGSNLAARLLAQGVSVRGVDAFTSYYDIDQKRANVAPLAQHAAFELVEADLLGIDPVALLEGVDVVYHQAGQPGVRLSWSDGFRRYDECNVLVTQRLLEAARSTPLERFVFASSSSVYGNAATYPTRETDLPRPHSPYGVTKLAAEHLCGLYGEVFGVPTVSLRYFTVYGPGQRPDMLMHNLIESALDGRPVTVYGDGSHVREFTYVGDVVDANLAAATAEVVPGTVVNVAGGEETTVAGVIELVGELLGAPVAVDQQPPKPGDVLRTGGAIEQARHLLGWAPVVGLREGLAAQIEWHRERRAAAAPAARGG